MYEGCALQSVSPSRPRSPDWRSDLPERIARAGSLTRPVLWPQEALHEDQTTAGASSCYLNRRGKVALCVWAQASTSQSLKYLPLTIYSTASWVSQRELHCKLWCPSVRSWHHAARQPGDKPAVASSSSCKGSVLPTGPWASKAPGCLFLLCPGIPGHPLNTFLRKSGLAAVGMNHSVESPRRTKSMKLFQTAGCR